MRRDLEVRLGARPHEVNAPLLEDSRRDVGAVAFCAPRGGVDSGWLGRRPTPAGRAHLSSRTPPHGRRPTAGRTRCEAGPPGLRRSVNLPLVLVDVDLWLRVGIVREVHDQGVAEADGHVAGDDVGKQALAVLRVVLRLPEVESTLDQGRERREPERPVRAARLSGSRRPAARTRWSRAVAPTPPSARDPGLGRLYADADPDP